MHILVSLVLVASLTTQVVAGSLAMCFCAATGGASTACCRSAKVVEPPACCCCPAARSADGETFCRQCDCEKQSQPTLQPAGKEFRRLPESPWIAPHAATLQSGLRISRLLPAASAIPHASRSLQELYCVWRE